MKDFREADEKHKKLVDDGKLSQDEYIKWRQENVTTSKWYRDMIDDLGHDMANVDKMAAEIINDKMPEIYALNHNYGTYEVEKGARINTSYTLYDRDTVMNLAIADPDLLPKLKPNTKLDARWNRNSFNSGILNGILTGASVPEIAKNVALGTTKADMAAAIRNARTATTSAENAGRINSYERARDMGIQMKQMWMAALDDRTRHEHRMLDGQTVNVGEAFHVNGYKIRYPGDPQAAPEMVYNCRCTLVAHVEGAKMSAFDMSKRNNKLEGMSYSEWKTEKSKGNDIENVYDVLSDYLDKKAEKGGRVIYSDGYSAKHHAEEIQMAEWIQNTFGGMILLNPESKERSMLTPDFTWNDKMWELKGVSSKNSADKNVQKALRQIEKNPGGIMIDYTNSEVAIDDLLSVVKWRMIRSEVNADTLFIKNGKVTHAIRYRKKKR